MVSFLYGSQIVLSCRFFLFSFVLFITFGFAFLFWGMGLAGGK